MKQKRFRINHIQHSPSIFSGKGSLDLPPKLVGKVLGAVANPQKRISALYAAQIDLRGILVPDRARAARKDHAFDGLVRFGEIVEGENLAVNVQLP